MRLRNMHNLRCEGIVGLLLRKTVTVLKKYVLVRKEMTPQRLQDFIWLIPS